MSTSDSPLWKLQKEARQIARRLKRSTLPDKPRIKFAVIMDDKVITVEIDRQVIVATTEEALEAMIVREMQGKKADA